MAHADPFCLLPFPCFPSPPPRLLPGHGVLSSPCGPATAWISTLWPNSTVLLSATLPIWMDLATSGSKPLKRKYTLPCHSCLCQVFAAAMRTRTELIALPFLFSFWEKALTLHLAKTVSIIWVDTSGKIPAVFALVLFYLLQIWRVFSPPAHVLLLPLGPCLASLFALL